MASSFHEVVAPGIFSQILLNVLKINSNTSRYLPLRLHVHVAILKHQFEKRKKGEKKNTKIATVTLFTLVPATTQVVEKAKTYII